MADWPNVIVEAAFASNPLDTAPIWSDISNYATQFSTSRGRPDIYTTFSAGTLNLVLDNHDGLFDPSYQSSPFYGQITPGRRIRLRAEYPSGSGTFYPIFDGYVQSWNPEYEFIGGEHVNVTAADAFMLLNLYTYTPTGGAPGEFSDDRILRVINAATPGLPVDLESGLTHIIADATLSDTALNHCQQVAQSEWGQFYISADGTATFENRYHRDTDSGSITPQSIFGDADPELEYFALIPTYGDQQLWNSAEITDGTGKVFRYDDPTAELEQVARTFTFTSLTDTPNEGYDQASWIVQTSESTDFWFDMSVQPVFDPTNLWPATLGLEISNLIQVNRRPPSGNVISRQCYIERISHATSLGMDDWQVTFGLSPQSLTSANFWQLDLDALDASAVLGY